MKAKFNVLSLIIFIAIPLVVGGISSLLTRQAMVSFADLNKPMLSPPAWLFPIAWTVLYVLMGIASYTMFYSNHDLASIALIVYALQLIMNFFWSIIFFNTERYWMALIWLLIMWGLIILLVLLTARFSIVGMICLIPLLAWTTFAAYLNFMIARMN